MKYIQIEIAYNFIVGLKLDFDKSFARRRFAKILKPAVDELTELRGEIIDRYCEKDKDGKRKVENRTIKYSVENKKKALAEYEKLNETEVKLDFKGHGPDLADCIKIYQSEIDKMKKETEDGMTDEEFKIIEDLMEIIKEFKKLQK